MVWQCHYSIFEKWGLIQSSGNITSDISVSFCLFTFVVFWLFVLMLENGLKACWLADLTVDKWQGNWISVKSAEMGERVRERWSYIFSFSGPLPTRSCFGALSPLYRDIWEWWIQLLLCFTCCTVTPKNTKLLSNSCSLLNYLTHYYIIPTGRKPDSCWLPANLVSVFLHLCLSFCHSTQHCTQMQMFLTVFRTTFLLFIAWWPLLFPHLLLTVCQSPLQGWQVTFYLYHCSPCVCQLRDRRV